MVSATELAMADEHCRAGALMPLTAQGEELTTGRESSGGRRLAVKPLVRH
jgi:hypothetical protein